MTYNVFVSSNRDQILLCCKVLLSVACWSSRVSSTVVFVQLYSIPNGLNDLLICAKHDIDVH